MLKYIFHLSKYTKLIRNFSIYNIGVILPTCTNTHNMQFELIFLVSCSLILCLEQKIINTGTVLLKYI